MEAIDHSSVGGKKKSHLLLWIISLQHCNLLPYKKISESNCVHNLTSAFFKVNSSCKIPIKLNDIFSQSFQIREKVGLGKILW